MNQIWEIKINQGEIEMRSQHTEIAKGSKLDEIRWNYIYLQLIST